MEVNGRETDLRDNTWNSVAEETVCLKELKFRKRLGAAPDAAGVVKSAGGNKAARRRRTTGASPRG